MYSKVYTTSGSVYDPTAITVEVGLSGGLPVIQVLGDVSGRYVRNSKKFYFIFSSSGRKLPSKKVRVLISGSTDASEDGLDLPIFVAIYKAINSLEDNLKTFCIGNISLDGTVSPPENIYLQLLNISSLEGKKKILLPPVELPQDCFPKDSVVFIRNIRDVYKFYEGIELDNKISSKNTPHREQQKALWIGWEIAKVLNRPILHICGETEKLSLRDFANDGTTSLISKVFRSDYSNVISVKGAKSLEILTSIKERFSLGNQYFYFSKESYNSFDMLDVLYGIKWIIEIPTCYCGSTSCSCSSKEYKKYKDTIIEVIERYEPIIINEYKLSEERDRFEDTVLNDQIPSEYKSAGKPLYKNILNLVNGIDKKRARELARILSIKP